MIGFFSARAAVKAQRQEAEADYVQAGNAARRRIEALDRACLQLTYLGKAMQPTIEKRGQYWFAIIEAGPSVPKVEKRA